MFSVIPPWATVLALIWMWFIPHFTAATIKAIYTQTPAADPIKAKTVALVFGLLWPIFFVLGILRLIFKK